MEGGCLLGTEEYSYHGMLMGINANIEYWELLSSCLRGKGQQ